MENENKLFFDEDLEKRKDDFQENPAKKIKTECFDPYDGNEYKSSGQELDVNGSCGIMVQDGLFKKEEFEDISIKEEIKEEISHNQKSPLTNENEQRQDENSMSYIFTEAESQNQHQERIDCPPSSCIERGLLQFNSDALACDKRGEVDKSQTNKSFKCTNCPYESSRQAHLRQHLRRTHTGNDCSRRWSYIRDYYFRRKENPGTGSAGEAANKRSDLLSFLDSIPSVKRQSTTNVVEIELNESETPKDTLPDVEQNLNSMTDSTTRDIEAHVTQVHATQAHAIEVHATQEHGRNKRDLNSTFECTKENAKKKKTSRTEERMNLLKEIAKRSDNPRDKELDETDLFFSSIAKIVKKLPRYEQINLRMEISSLVGNAELRNISHLSSGSSDSSRPGTALSTSVPITLLSPITCNEASNVQQQYQPVLSTCEQTVSSVIVPKENISLFNVTTDTASQTVIPAASSEHGAVVITDLGCEIAKL